MKKISIFIIIIFIASIFGATSVLSYDSEISTDYNGYLVKVKETAGDSVRLMDEDASEASPSGLYLVEDYDEVKQLLKDGVVEYFEPNYTVKLTGEVNDTYYSKQWNLDRIDASTAWEQGFTGEGVRVAVIDTGVNMAHEEFENADILEGYNVIADSNDVTDYYGHGSFIAGILAAARNNGKGIAGMTEKVSIIPIKCFSSTNETSANYVIDAIYMAIDEYNCDILNLSLGLPQDMVSFREAINYAESQGALVIASVGNDSGTSLIYPAAYENVIGVGSVGMEDNVSLFSQRNTSVTVVAPGEHIYSVGYNSPTSYVEANGTSFAAPQVTAMAAMAKSYNREISSSEFIELLKNTSMDMGADGYDTSYGYGLVNVQSFLELLKGEHRNIFTDVRGMWAEDSIYFCFDRNLFKGVSETSFEPDSNMTRAMFVTVLARLSGEDLSGLYTQFSDVPAGTWFTDSVSWGANKNIVYGKDLGKFDPYGSVTREEMAVFMYRYSNYFGLVDSSPTTDLSSYNDAASISPWAAEAMNWAVSVGLINGRTATTLEPSGTATRAEVATIIMRFINTYL